MGFLDSFECIVASTVGWDFISMSVISGMCSEIHSYQ